MSEGLLFPINTAAGGVGLVRPKIPRVPELVELWGNYLEFWAQSGGMDEAEPEEFDQAHDAVQARAKEILGGPSDRGGMLYSNLALAAAKELRRAAFSAEPEDFYG